MPGHTCVPDVRKNPITARAPASETYADTFDLASLGFIKELSIMRVEKVAVMALSSYWYTVQSPLAELSVGSETLVTKDAV